MDLILGDQEVRKQLEAGKAIPEIENLWQDELQAFDLKRKNYFLY